MNPEIQNQINRIQNFNENESKKVIELKKLFTSKLFLGLIISSILVMILLFVTNFVNQLIAVEKVDYKIVISLIGDGILNLLFPGVFVFFLITLYKKAKTEILTSKSGIISNLFSFRTFTKFYFIITIIGMLSNGITFSQIETLQQISPELYASLVANSDDLAMIKVLGLYYLIQTGFITCIWFSLARFTKIILRSIIFDNKETKFIDGYLFIGFFIGQSLIEVFGMILSLCGITNPLTGVYFVPPIIPSDILFILYSVGYFALTILISFVFIKIMKILNSNSGSTNPLRNEDSIVYTIKLDEEEGSQQ